MNLVAISGNLARDPEIRSSQSGMSIANFTVVVNDRKQNKQTGEWEDVPNYVRCVAFGGRADMIGRNLSKGSKVAVEGKLHYSAWEDKDGNKRNALEVTVNDIVFLSQGQRSRAQSAAADVVQAAYKNSNAYQQPTYEPPVSQAPAGYQGPPAADVYDEDIPF